MSIKPQMPLQTFAVFWRNTEKSEAAMSLLWSAEVLIILDYCGENWIIMQWNSIKTNLNVVSLLLFMMVWSDLKALTPQVWMAGVVTEKPGTHPRRTGACSCYSPWLEVIYLTLFICSLKLGVDTEKLRFQKAALKAGLFNLEYFRLDHDFSVLLEAPECRTEKLWCASTRRRHC